MTGDDGDTGTALVTPDFSVPKEGGNWVTAEFYAVTKKVNSTYTPPAGSGCVYDVVLKNGTSLASPTLTIQGFEPKYNYFWFQNCYYYVSDVVRINNTMCEVSGTRDALATHKEEIYNSTAYVEYCSTKYNKWLPDQRLSMTGKTAINVESVNIIPASTTGTFVLGVAGTGTQSNIGFTSMYSMSRNEAQSFADVLYDESFIAELKKFFNDPYEAIISAHWVPFTPLHTAQQIYCGAKGTGIIAGALAPEITKNPTTVTLNIPKRNGDWRDLSPYSQYKLYLPFYGTVDLDGAIMQKYDTMTVQYLLDAISGEVSYTVMVGSWIGTFTVGTAVNLAVGQSSGNNITAIGSAAAGAAGAIVSLAAAPVTGGTSVAAYAGLATGIGAIAGGWMTSMTHDVSAKGGQGGFGRGNTVLYGDSKLRSIRLVQYSFEMAEGDPSGINPVNGRPLFDTVKLSSVWGGYIQTAGASIPIDGLAEDRAQVNGMLNSGIFVE